MNLEWILHIFPYLWRGKSYVNQITFPALGKCHGVIIGGDIFCKVALDWGKGGKDMERRPIWHLEEALQYKKPGSRRRAGILKPVTSKCLFPFWQFAWFSSVQPSCQMTLKVQGMICLQTVHRKLGFEVALGGHLVQHPVLRRNIHNNIIPATALCS